MIRISVEVSNGPAQFRVSVQAQTIERALEIAQRHNPGKEGKVAFPLDPETFFVRDLAALDWLIESEQPGGVAA